MNNFDLTKEYLGYKNGEEQTSIDPRYMVAGSKNWLVDQGRKSITSRPGMAFFGTDSNQMTVGVLGEYSGMVAKNNWRILKTYDRYLAVYDGDTDAWVEIKTDLATPEVSFSRIFDNTEKNGVLNFVDGTGNVHTWSGGMGKVASNTANSITLQETYTATTIAFVDGGASADTITDTANGFVTAGFAAGQRIKVSGSASNNRAFTIASVSAGIITLVSDDSVTTEAAGASVLIHTGFPTWKSRGFFSAGTRSVIVNGVTYSYTGGETGATLTGMSGLPAFAAGDLVVQAVRTTAFASPIPTGYTADFCATQRNQFWIGSAINLEIFASNVGDYTDFSYTANRLPGEGVQLSLDGFCAGFQASETDITIFDSSEGIYTVLFEKSSDNTAEAVSVVKKKTNDGQGLKSPNAKAAIKNAVAYITTEPTLDTIGNVENISNEQSRPLSEDVKRDFDSLDFTDCFMKYWKRNIVISLPAESKLFLYDLRYSMWQPPQEFAVSIGALSLDEDGNLIGHGYASNQSYTLFTGTNDGPTGAANEYYAITSEARFPYNNYGSVDDQKTFTKYWVDGYIPGNAILIHEFFYDIAGSSGTASVDIHGDDEEILYGISDLNPLGRNPLGTRQIGGSGSEEQTPLQRFRQILPYAQKAFYEGMSLFTCETLDAQVTIVNHGPEIFGTGSKGTKFNKAT